MKRRRFLAIAVLLLSVGVLACCSVSQTYLYAPGDTVVIRSTPFKIISRTTGHQRGCFYNVIDLKRQQYVPVLAQKGMKPYLKPKNND